MRSKALFIFINFIQGLQQALLGFDIIYFQLSIYVNKTMLQKESSFLEKFKQEKELRQLQMQLEGKNDELQGKEARIIELQNFISHVQNTSSIRDKFKEDETQCSFDEDSFKEQADLIKRLGEVLNARQQQGMGLHLASRQIEEENAKLKLTLQQKQEEANQLKEQVTVMEGYLHLGVRDLEFLCNENKSLKERVTLLESEELAKDEKLSQLQIHKKALENVYSQKRMLQDALNAEEQRSRRLQQETADLKGELEIHVLEVERTKGALNSYDWKLFCLQTELDLVAKQKKQLKFTNEKLELRLAEMEVTVKQQRTAVFSGEEEIRLLQSQNRYLRVQADRRQETMDKLLVEIDIMRQDLEEQEQNKELEYRLKEKDEQLNQIVRYLKQKIAELDQAKNRAALIDKKLIQLEVAVQKKEHENYELEQSIIEHEEIMEKQSAKIQQLQQNMQAANKIIEDNAILSILRASEWTQVRSELDSLVQAQNQKINQLTVQIIQRDIAAHKEAEKIKDVQQELERIQQDLLEMYTKLTQSQAMASKFKIQAEKLEQELQLANIRNRDQQLSLMQKDKLMAFIQEEMKAVFQQKQELKFMSGKLVEELDARNEQIAALKDKAIQYIEDQLNYEYEIEELKKQLQTAKNQLTQSVTAQEAKSEQVQQMRQQVNQLNRITQLRIRQMTELLCRSLQNAQQPQQTLKFQIMQEEEQNFEVMECKYEKQRNELKTKIELYKSEVVSIMRNFD